MLSHLVRKAKALMPRRQLTLGELVEKAKSQLDREPATAPAQWETLQSLLMEAGPHACSLLAYVYAEHQGYTNVRVQAGTELLKRAPASAWEITRRLLISEDPDDRDAALGVLVDSGDPCAPRLARPLLADPWPYIRFDAAEFLRDTYPTEVVAAVSELLEDKEAWVRREARGLLAQMHRNAGTSGQGAESGSRPPDET